MPLPQNNDGGASKALAIIPAYNEAAAIATVVARARPHVAEVVVVDDGSTDDTAAQATAAGARVLRHAANRGKGAAILTGLEHFARSTAGYAVFLDADGQHDPAEIPKFIACAAAQRGGIVLGTRMGETREMPRLRLWTNRFTSWVTSRLARQRLPDSQCGYRLLSREVLASLDLKSCRFEAETEMLIQAGRAGQRITSVPVRTIYDARLRASHIRPLSDSARFLRLVWRYGLGGGPSKKNFPR